MLKTCPICGSHAIGQIGFKRYFCAECCHEVVVSTKKNVAYYPSEDGEIRVAGKTNEVAEVYAKVQEKKTKRQIS